MNQPARAKLDSVDLWNDVVAKEAQEKTWKVALPTGTRAMTIEELDEAFERSVIGLHTLVQRPSGGEWRTLGEAAGVEDSIRPVSSDFELIDIPLPPPLPKRILEASATEPLTDDELSFVRPRKTGRRLAFVAALGLLAGGLCAWRYMPAQPIAGLATTTIMAPQAPALAAAPEAAMPLPATSPETSPAPEGNALAEAKIAVPAKAVAATMKAPAAKKQAHGKTRKGGKKKHV